MVHQAPYPLVIDTPVPGWLIGVRLAGEAVVAVDFLRVASGVVPQAAAGPLAREVRAQMAAYFRGVRRRFSLPLAPVGTEFQRRVWQRLTEIPCGMTCSYGELAEELGTGPRPVGGACRANPIPILIPCHRVVAGRGLGGYGGDTRGRQLKLKSWLLTHEAPR